MCRTKIEIYNPCRHTGKYFAVEPCEKFGFDFYKGRCRNPDRGEEVVGYYERGHLCQRCGERQGRHASGTEKIKATSPIATRPAQRHGNSSPNVSPVSPPGDYAKKYRPGLGGGESPVSPIEFRPPEFGGLDGSPNASPNSSVWGPLSGKPDHTRPPAEDVRDVRHQPHIQNYSNLQGKPKATDYSVRGPYDGERPVTKFPTPYIRQPSPPRPQLKNRLSRPFDDPVTQFPGAEYSPPPPVPRVPPKAEVALGHKKTHGEDHHHRAEGDAPRKPHHHRAKGDEEGHRRHRHHRAEAEEHRHRRRPHAPKGKSPVTPPKTPKEAIQWIRKDVRDNYELRPWARSIKDGFANATRSIKEIKAAVLPDKRKLHSYDVGEKNWKNEKFR